MRIRGRNLGRDTPARDPGEQRAMAGRTVTPWLLETACGLEAVMLTPISRTPDTTRPDEEEVTA